ncbi:FMN-binding negative transcriptional regulator [Litoreibacter roseus]|uniref:Negative transcriptional regulator, PaiB family n=1 Tax=Litoreibacter roseus TaxID=2601869 RepID=A0A6N6JGK4_9RHOB|nr:FMN-binding negative transcriptional regulator [Litoreibacter roseus]GFE64342.1 hypothetical protein KIN_14160 [Litoreibacter roseus]
MHPNPAFRTEPEDRNIGFARERAFGTLAVNGPDAPLTAHVPFLLSENGAQAELHLVRSNPIVRVAKSGSPAALTILGPDGYISPDWYGVPDQVPTWNYVAVRITGQLELAPQETLHGTLDRLSAHFEDQLLPKPPWLTTKMSDGVMERMMRMIVPLTIKVTQIDATWKLGQNKPDAARVSAAEHMAAFGLGTDTKMLAALMQGASSENAK